MSIFENISVILYEGPESRNTLAFRYYNADRVVAGKPMREHLDRDIAPEGESLAEFRANLDVIVDLIEKKMRETGIKCRFPARLQSGQALQTQHRGQPRDIGRAHLPARAVRSPHQRPVRLD